MTPLALFFWQAAEKGPSAAKAFLGGGLDGPLPNLPQGCAGKAGARIAALHLDLFDQPALETGFSSDYQYVAGLREALDNPAGSTILVDLTCDGYTPRGRRVEKLQGTVTSGTGEGTLFLGFDWVRAEIRSACGFDPFPGTLNVVLTSPTAVRRWSEIRKSPGRPLTPPAPDSCGGRLFPVLVADTVPGAVVVPDVTRYGKDLLEVIAPVHLKSHLGLRDGDRIRLTLFSGEKEPWPTM